MTKPSRRLKVRPPRFDMWMSAGCSAVLAIAVVVLLAGCAAATKAHKTETDTLNIEAMIQPLDPARHILRDDDWFWWGASVIRGPAGKYHMFCSRWPKKYGFTSWLTHSEIAHAVADAPAGPYRYVETALRSRGDHDWDRFTAHNPKIKQFGDLYYLYFIGTHLDLTEEQLIDTARVGYRHEFWMPLRNNQRTGVATSQSLTGPWRRSAQPVIEPAGPITKLTVNPGICQGPDGRYVMIVKGDKPGSSQRNQAIALADAPEGPWEIQPRPAIEDFDTEDASIWYDRTRQRFYAVYHAHTHIGMITSTDGINWTAARHPRVMSKTIALTTGGILEPARLERPFVLLDENDQPLVLFCSIREKDGDTANIHVPLGKR